MTDTPQISSDAPLLQVADLHVEFPVRHSLRRSGVIRAVDGVSFELHQGETLGIVGESGSGKSTLGLAIVGVEKPASGTIDMSGDRISQLSERQLRPYRSRFQMIFQNPQASLNPRMTIGDSIAEPLRLHGMTDRAKVAARIDELLSLVGLPGDVASRYPHMLSGGQQQRVAIARALAGSPDLIICDEPVSSLDVSIQAQITNLLIDLQEELGVAYVFIAHDLALVRQISDRVLVMYMGQIVEMANSDDLYGQPLHPYTHALLSASPIPDADLERSRERIILEGDAPSPLSPPSGCKFRTRCRWAQERCAEERPALRPAADGHLVACHFYEDIAAATETALPWLGSAD